MDDKKGFLSELIRLMRADSMERQEELEMLWATSVYLGIEKPEFDKLIQFPEPFDPPKEEPERIVQFYQMAMLVRADFSHGEKEVNYFSWLAIKMGLREEAALAIISRIEENPLEFLKPQEVIQIFQVFHN